MLQTSINGLTNEFREQLKQRKEKMGVDSLIFTGRQELATITTTALSKALRAITIDVLDK